MRLFKLVLTGLLILAVMSMFSGDLTAVEKKIEKGTDSRININTAGVDQLTTLPGIGKTKAERIMAYRKQHGRFRKIQEIMKVKGIGEKTFKKFSGKIRV